MPNALYACSLVRVRCAGSALVAVLWCTVILTTIVMSSLGAARLDARLAKNHGDQVQAYYLALAGVEKSKALVYALEQRLKSSGESLSQELFDNAAEFKEVRLGRGHFSVRRGALEGEASERGIVYGLVEEERFLDLNVAALEELVKVPGLDPAFAATIVDWRDADNQPSEGGAEQPNYDAMGLSTQVANDRLLTTQELLRLVGADSSVLFGEDADCDGLLDPEERDGSMSMPADNGDSVLETGILAYVSLEASERDVDPHGEPRLSLGTVTADEMRDVPGISADLADAIVRFRDVRGLEGVAALLNVERLVEEQQPQPTPPPNNGEGNPSGTGSPSSGRSVENPPGNPPADGAPNPNNNAPTWRGTGEMLISTELFQQISDYFTTAAGMERPGVVNINTASATVLACLPGVSEELAQNIVEHRLGHGNFQNIAGLLSVSGINAELYAKLSQRVTARARTYRVISEGLVPSTGARQSLRVVFRIGELDVETLSFREDL
ncbi:MAG: helix-hairpin-helix domain-containing protein [Planctomycetota bacterium]